MKAAKALESLYQQEPSKEESEKGRSREHSTLVKKQTKGLFFYTLFLFLT